MSLLVSDAAFDVFPGHWRTIVAGHRALRSRIATMTSNCYRLPVRLAEDRDLHEFASALRVCCAYGQYLDVPPADRQRGQFGLYGTAAALELLACAPPADHIAQLDNAPPTEEFSAWADRFLRTWLFFRVSVLRLGGPEVSKFWAPDRNTLRLCGVLSCIGRVKPILEQLTAHRLTRLGLDATLSRHLNVYDGIIYQDIADAVVARLRGAVVDAAPESIIEAIKNKRTRSVAFSTEDPEPPARDGAWLYLWASVIRAVADAYSANVITEDQARSLITSGGLIDFKKAVRICTGTVDPRYILYALWAWGAIIDHRLPDALDVADDSKWFVAHARWVATTIVTQEVAQMDLHAPYEIYFQTAPSGPKYHYDYFVIPTLPILIHVVASYDPHTLFGPRFHDVLAKVIETVRTPTDIGVLPGQLTEINATVNAAHYCRAAKVVADAIEERVRRSWLLATVGFCRDRSRGIALSIIFLASGVATATLGSGTLKWIAEKALVIPAWEGMKKLFTFFDRKIWPTRK